MPPGACVGSALTQANQNFLNAYSRQDISGQAQAQHPQLNYQTNWMPVSSFKRPIAFRVTEKTKEKPMNYVKEYFYKHREMIMGLGIIILLDHFIFKDAFREKLQKIVQSLLDKTEKKLGADA